MKYLLVLSFCAGIVTSAAQVAADEKHNIAVAVEEMRSAYRGMIPLTGIGEQVMTRLKNLDEVAYVRFASVYKSFKDVNTFMDELMTLLNEKK